MIDEPFSQKWEKRNTNIFLDLYTNIFLDLYQVMITNKTDKSQRLKPQRNPNLPKVGPRRKFNLFINFAYCSLFLCMVLWNIPQCSELLKELSRCQITIKALWQPMSTWNKLWSFSLTSSLHEFGHLLVLGLFTFNLEFCSCHRAIT